MGDTELLRTFLSVYRAGSLTDAATRRGISQPAVSQHVAALERLVGRRLFVRGPSGVSPTAQATELFARVTEPLDALEDVIGDLRRGPDSSQVAPVRFGSSAEYFSAELLPRLAGREIPVTAVFGTDADLLPLLEHGQIDVAVTSRTPSRKSTRAVSIGAKRFTLVAAPGAVPQRPLSSVPELAAWLPDQPWASYSVELPITRRFWHRVVGRPFSARAHLVAPDLRAVVRAVELGVGVSLLPTFVCAASLAEGRIVEPYPVTALVEEEPWFACVRSGETRRPAVAALLDALVHRDMVHGHSMSNRQPDAAPPSRFRCGPRVSRPGDHPS
ncbi:MAG: LysR family transcriptional regulator [Actinomycetota bacterium]|nr:LysR family transcriptional regulator [Actinomycetota bacterium]